MSDTQAPFSFLGTFADPSSFDAGAAKLTNVRVVMRQASEGKPAKTRLVGTPGLTAVCQPVASPCIVMCRALNTLWSGHANGQIYSGVNTDTPTLRAIALRFALANERVSSVVLGPRTSLQLDQLVREAKREPPYIEPQRLSELRERLVTVGVQQ